MRPGLLSVFLIYFSVPEQIQSYILWTFGSFGSVTWRQMPVLICAISLGLLLAFLCIKPLNALLLGENYARSMGLECQAHSLMGFDQCVDSGGCDDCFLRSDCVFGSGCATSLPAVYCIRRITACLCRQSPAWVRRWHCYPI